MTKQTLSDERIDEIEAKVAELRTRIDRRNPWPSDNESHWTTEGWKAGTRNALDKLHVEALLAEVRRLRDELDRRTEDLAFLERTTLPETRRDIQHHQDGKQRWRERAERAEAALTQIRHLHKDSPMGPCPVCIDADAVTAGGDGLMPYPCPTGRLAGAQDCDPPSRPAPAPAVPAGDGQQQ